MPPSLSASPRRPCWRESEPEHAQPPPYQIGAILVSMNPAYKERELEYALARCGVSHLVMATGWRDLDYVDLLAVSMPASVVLVQG